MDGIPLKKIKLESKTGYYASLVDIKKCIICQGPESQNTSSSEDGRSCVIYVVSKWQDVVNERLRTINENQFVYHVTNNCYKTYTLQKTLDGILERQMKDSEGKEKTSVLISVWPP